jgi:hypothetical protein
VNSPAVVVPPLRLRMSFWLISRRLSEPYRQWAATQLLDPGYRRRRAIGMFGTWFAVVATLEIADGITSGFHWWSSIMIVAGPLFGVVVGLFATPKQEALSLTLAYHGVSPDGQLVAPIDKRELRRRTLTRPSLALSMIAAQGFVAVCAASVVVARALPARANAAMFTCRSATSSDRAALGTYRSGWHLAHIHRVLIAPGVVALAADVTGAAGQPFGRGLWLRHLPNNAFHQPPGLDPANEVAAQVSGQTNSIGVTIFAPIPACLPHP